MAASTRTQRTEKIDRLLAEAAGADDLFASERLADEALGLAHRLSDYERMISALESLLSSRRRKRAAAIESGAFCRLSDSDGDAELTAGCWLIEPPLVGADGRALRDRADDEGVPIALVVREPQTMMRMWPVVMVGPITVRTQIDPPDGEPDAPWLLVAAEALGDAAIEMVDPDLEAEQRVNELFELLATVRDHDGLHEALMQACRDALDATLADTAAGTRRKAS